MKKNADTHLPYLAILVVLICCYFYQVIFLDHVFLVGDNFSVNIPFTKLLVESLKQGEFPLWNPYILTGVPFIVGSNIHAFPTLLLFFVYPSYVAMTYTVIVVTIVAGISMYFFSCQTGKERLGALFSSLIYIFSGIFAKAHASSVSMFSLMYVPLVLLLLTIGVKKNKSIYAVLSGMSLFLFFLSGHPMILYITLLFSSLFVILGLDNDIRRKIKILGISAGTFILISLPFLQFQLEFSRLSSRTAQDFSYASSYALQFKDIPTLILPHLYGIPEIELKENSGSFLYLGVIPLIMAFYGMRAKGKTIWFFSICSFVGFILLLGRNTLLYSLIYFIPGVSLFRQPAYFYIITLFSLSILSGVGIVRFKNNLKNIQKIVVKYLTIRKRIILTIFTAGVLGFILYLTSQNLQFWQETVKHIHSVSLGKDLETLLTKTGKIRFIILYNLSDIVLLLTIFTVFLGILRKTANKSVIITSIILLSFIDLFFINQAEYFFIPRDLYEQELLSFEPPEFLKDPNIRIASYQSYIKPDWNNFNREKFVLYKLKTNSMVLGPNRNMLDNVYSIMGFNPLIPENIVSHVTVDNLPHIVGLTGDDIKLDQEALSKAGVNYILSDIPFDKQFLTLVHTIPGKLYVYRNNNALPRVFLTDGENQHCCVTVKSAGVNELLIEVDATKDVKLVVLDTFYPSWNASIDSVYTDILPYNNTFRIISVPKGKHRVIFTFTPFNY